MGWFAAMGVLQFLLWVTATVVKANHGSPYDSMAPIVRGLFSGNDALALWQGIGTGAAYLVAYCIGGVCGWPYGAVLQRKAGHFGVDLAGHDHICSKPAHLFHAPGFPGKLRKPFPCSGIRSTVRQALFFRLRWFSASPSSPQFWAACWGGLYHRRVERYAQNYVGPGVIAFQVYSP